jgi:SpoVK/Ycf46/Vps4 family AAA+-type ATPase
MKLRSTSHPSPLAKAAFERLVGIDTQKDTLLLTLELILDRERFTTWRNKHHGTTFGLGFLVDASIPLVVLSGDVGSGKTALATSIGTPLAAKIGKVAAFEIPSDVRGTGLVGEVSLRVTEAFAQARAGIARGPGILIIDEGDDLATSREQLQAHHEDRAAVNVLLKEIDRLAIEGLRLAVILITNRPDAIDPALLRRAVLHLNFGRPTRATLEHAWSSILAGVRHNPDDLIRIVAFCSEKKPGYTHSDLVHRVGHTALMRAYQENRALAVRDLEWALHSTEPSPVFRSSKV